MSILNYFQNLPFDIQEHIWKTYYSNNVLNEINNNFIRKRDYYYPVNDRWSLKGYYSGSAVEAWWAHNLLNWELLRHKLDIYYNII